MPGHPGLGLFADLFLVYLSAMARTRAESEKPRWLRDLLRFLPFKSQFVLSGNVRDLQLTEVSPGSLVPWPLLSALAFELRERGYAQVLVYDLLQGFRVLHQPGDPPDSGQRTLVALGLRPGESQAAPAELELFAEVLQRLVQRPPTDPPLALVVDFASRLTMRPDSLTASEHQAFSRALILSHQAKPRSFGTPPQPYFDSILWLVDNEGELPAWLLVGNPRIRHIPVASPDHRARRALSVNLLRVFADPETPPDLFEAACDQLVEETEGLLLTDLKAITQLSRAEGLNLSSIGEAVRRYKVGVKDDPWSKIDRDKIREGDAYVRERVRGQEPAVVHLLDIVKRAVTGVGAPRRGNRPRGVAFLAGPTGVGKTELAKTLTRLLFGDDQAYIRFDMSEFSAEHSDQRLIGAPPGYVGYDVGGELTNAIREKPFAVVLFDEIEKAHPRILDKFLQILDDGVLTSGRGDRVYFSEAFIVFTSNLGIYRLEPDGRRVPNVTADQTYEEVSAGIRGEIERYFKIVLNRPEILNRIGDNILVLDFIRPAIAETIFGHMVASVLADVQAGQGVQVELGEAATAQLRKICLADLSLGGRGIRNKVETHLINPLARAFFDADVQAGQKLLATALEPGEAGETRLRLEALA